MRGLRMMNADKQTFLTQTGPTVNGQTSGTTSQERKLGPVENIQSDEGQEIPGNKDLCRGMNISHSNWGQDHRTDELLRRSNSTGEIIRGGDGSLGNNHQSEASKDHQILPNQRDHIC